MIWAKKICLAKINIRKSLNSDLFSWKKHFWICREKQNKIPKYMPTIFLPTRYFISSNLMDDLLHGTYMVCRWSSPDMSLGKNPLNPWLSRPLSYKKKKRELNSANKNIRLNFVHTTWWVSKMCLIICVHDFNQACSQNIYIYIIAPSVPKWVTCFDYF